MLGLLSAIADLKGPNDHSDADAALVSRLQQHFSASAAGLWRLDEGTLRSSLAGDAAAVLESEGNRHAVRQLFRHGGAPAHAMPFPESRELKQIYALVGPRQRPLAILQMLIGAGSSAAEQVEIVRCLKIVADLIRSWYEGPGMGMRTESTSLHRSLDRKVTCGVIAEEARRQLQVDRATVLLKRGSRFVATAISGQAQTDRRSVVVRQMEQLVERAMHLGPLFCFPDDVPELPPQVERSLDDYLDASDAKSLYICKLPVTLASEMDGEVTADASSGVLCLERFAGTPLVRGDVPTTFVTSAGLALHNALEHDKIFLLPFWRLLGRLTSPAYRLRSAVILAGLILSAVALAVIPTTNYVTADGMLQPAERSHIFAPEDGIVESLHVRHGDFVAANEAITTLANAELTRRIEEVRGRMITTQEQLHTVRTLMLGSRARKADQGTDYDRLAPQEEQLRIELTSLENQLELLRQQNARLMVKSPLDGQVVTWDVEHRLATRPVVRGQILLTVANVDGPWQLDLRVADRHAGIVLDADRREDSPLEVRFVLASDPEQEWIGYVKEIDETTSTEQDGAVVIRVIADFDHDQLTRVRPGAPLQARIDCGQRSVGYVWCRDLIAFVHSHILFYLH